MSSVKCPQCNLTNWSTAITCKRCGGFLQPVGEGQFNEFPRQESEGGNFVDANQNINAEFTDSAASQANSQWSQPNGQQNYQEHSQQYAQAAGYPYPPPYKYYQLTNLKSGMAIASMVLGIAAFVTMIIVIGILIAPIGLAFGIIALVKANKHPHIYGGKSFAIAGIVTSSIVITFLPVVAAIAIPNLLASRRIANEASALSTLKTISAAETNYMASSYGKCGDVQTLIATRFLDVSLSSSEKNGYRFMVVNLPSGGCEILATPISSSQGTRSFYYSTQEGILRGGAKKGLPADRNDFPIKNDISDKPTQNGDVKPSEAAAISILRTIQTAEASYSATVGQGEAGDLQVLAMQGLIKQDLADGEDAGYRFKVMKFPQKGWEVYATPISSTYGVRSMYVGMEGVIRGVVKNGLPADKNDPPLNF